MIIIVGLGNVGDRYAHTYHNLGFLTAECLALRFNAEFIKKECDALTAHAEYRGKKVILAKPQTMMNLSGRAVQKLLKFYKCEPKDLLVIFDDIDIEKGKIKFKERGSGGTHNGMRDIVFLIDEEFPRIKVGCGRPPEGRDLASFVLSQIPKSDRKVFASAIEDAADRAEAWLE